MNLLPLVMFGAGTALGVTIAVLVRTGARTVRSTHARVAAAIVSFLAVAAPE